MEYIKIDWYDVVAEEDVDKKTLNGKTPTQLLAHKRGSTGRIHAEDDTAIVLVRDEDAESISYLVIPKAVIITRTILTE